MRVQYLKCAYGLHMCVVNQIRFKNGVIISVEVSFYISADLISIICFVVVFALERLSEQEMVTPMAHVSRDNWK